MRKISSFIELPFKRENPVSSSDSDEDKYPESFPRHFIDLFTKEGDKIFDPFLGHGTTAIVAEEMNRVPFGIEADDERFDWSVGMIDHWQNVRCSDALEMLEHSFPKMDFCVTSPPFMGVDHTWNPLYEGDPKFGTYKDYLEKITLIFKQLKDLMKRNSYIAVHVDNVNQRAFTPLVRDMSICISEHFKPSGEVIIKWQDAPEAYPHTHCLIFRNTL